MPWRGPDYEGEVPSLGWNLLDWFGEYLPVPDGPTAGDPLRLTSEQAQLFIDFYSIDPRATGPAIKGRALRNARLFNRCIYCRPKGHGKSPILGAAGIGEACAPVVFDGWDAYGEPVGRPWNSLGFKAKVQILAVSEDQTANTWDPLLDMVRGSPALMSDYGLDPMETFIVGPNIRIEYATSSGDSREGGRPIFAVLDQALALDTPIPTPDGWTTMGELRAGDLVYGATGLPVRVAEAKPVSTEHRCFVVTLADGTEVTASAGHLWQTKVRGSAANPRVRTTEEMAADGRVFRIPVAPAQERAPRDLPVSPYLLGLWLGDGTRGKCEISVHEDDLEAIQDALIAEGVESWPRRYTGTGRGFSPTIDAQINLSFSRVRGFQGAGRPEVAKALAALDCYLDKHLPDDYLLGSIEQRTAVVQGLMDSDGSVTAKGTCTFVNTNPRIVRALVELLRSLGQVTSGAKWVADPRYTSGGKYRVDFTPRSGFLPFRLPRKAARVVQHHRGPEWITVTAIREVPPVAVRCIGVESDDHLFAFGPGGHLTHNTESWRSSNGGAKLAAAVRRNLTKTQGTSIESPNAYIPGDGSVAESSFKAADLQKARHAKTPSYLPTILLDHRAAPDDTDIYDQKSLKKGLAIAYGDSADVNGGWVNLDRVVEDFWDPDSTVEDSRRFFLNQITAAADSWLSQLEVDAVNVPHAGLEVPAIAAGQMITMGFDGSRGRKKGVTDSTALIGCRVSDGHLFELGVWEQPKNWPRDTVWEPPVAEVVATVAKAFKTYRVAGFYGDPSKWESYFAKWEARYGTGDQIKAKASAAHPFTWWMAGQRSSRSIAAFKTFKDAVLGKTLTFDGSIALRRHLLNARMVVRAGGIWIEKKHPDSEDKIDVAIAAVLAYQARLDAIAAGALKPPRRTRRAPIRKLR